MKHILIILLLFNIAYAQVTTNPTFSTITFPTNKYLCLNCNGNSVFPAPMHSRFLAQAMDTVNAIHVEDYGLKGDGTTLNDAAAVKAFNAAAITGKTLIFASGKTYLFSKQSVINVPAGANIKVWAKGATLKMANLTKYSMFQFTGTQNAYTYDLTWVGGTLDGNQTFQTWPDNPRGGQYNGDFLEAHGSMVLVDWGNNVTFYGVHVANPVVDGISIRKSFLALFMNSTADGAADLRYASSSEQGTYFKVTRAGYKTAYFLNISCIGGSIGIHSSFENAGITFDTTTLTVIHNYYSKNNIQNAIHIEDCAKTFIDSANVDNDLGNIAYPSILFSNRSILVVVQNSTFRNQRLNFSTAVSLRAGFVKNCQFVTDIPTNASVRLNNFIEGGATHVDDCTFTGEPAGDLVKTQYMHGCTFKNYGTTNWAVYGVYMVDSSTFIGGKAINFRSGNTTRSYFNTFTNTVNTNSNSTSPPAGWEAPWTSKIQVTIKNRTRQITAK